MNRWTKIALIGCVMIVVALIIASLVIADKEHFGWMVGPRFLPLMSIGIFGGALLVIVGAWKMTARARWTRILLAVWGVIALTSPAFGFLFLLPWGVLVLLLPAVIWALATELRAA